MRNNARTWYSLTLFAVTILAVVFVKPKFIYREDGTLYEFGLGPDKSVFSFGVVVAFIAIISSFMFAIGDMIYPPSLQTCKKIAVKNLIEKPVIASNPPPPPAQTMSPLQIPVAFPVPVPQANPYMGQVMPSPGHHTLPPPIESPEERRVRIWGVTSD
ncbi:hypothetical protein TetV_153 [Tetraselmis virus 1]|uniref:Uncharacterized protein n=1 Tax=Tetraselmis virus 1 TaxID=2060617 RepID=A0A2P0VMV8_9VIRU|nr:hypothetical protein QJ968_gp153 [Tetraselmis virus 1]AUF82245.1 hypothetical protein TetV_153 [Tetraselmis virus 1]